MVRRHGPIYRHLSHSVCLCRTARTTAAVKAPSARFPPAQLAHFHAALRALSVAQDLEYDRLRSTIQSFLEFILLVLTKCGDK
jgi:hypothetical protein